MAVSSGSFPPRKRRPSAGSFISPHHLSDQKLLQSLFIIAQEISSLKPLNFLLNRNTSSLIRKSQLLSTLFEEILHNHHQVNTYPPSAVLCFEELYVVLQRSKALLEDCSGCSRMWLLLQNESISNSFHELTTELTTILDIFPAREFSLNEDVQELLALLKRHCLSEKKSYIDPRDKFLRSQVLTILDDINLKLVPDNKLLLNIFQRLNLSDSSSCRDEIESLEDELSNQEDENSKADVMALIGVVRFAKCVLYDGVASSPGTTRRRRGTAADVNIPADFRCPISLDLMHDPVVVVATGQTYDRLSITSWIQSGHNTCPKTGQTLTSTELIPNCAIKNLIAMWCRDQRIPFETAEGNNTKSKGMIVNKTALEAAKMTAAFLLSKLSEFQCIETTNRVVHELRVLAKTDSDSRAFIAQAGALPLLVRFLGSDNPNLQVNAVTTILNLSILEANKTLIMETEGVLNCIIQVLRFGATWEAKGNAAATIFSLTSVQAYKKKLGRSTLVIKGLIHLAKEGPTSAKSDAMVAILNLSGDRESIEKLIENGVVDMVSQVLEAGLLEEAITILEVVVRKGGLVAVAAAYRMISNLAEILREGSDRARESAAATLVNMCRKGGSQMVAELAAVPGIERMVWEIMGTGTSRGRRKAATLLRILRRWASGLDYDVTLSSYSNLTISPSTPIVLPG